MWTLKDSFSFFILAWVVVSVFLIVVNLFLKKNLKEISKGEAMSIIDKAGRRDD